FQSISRRIFPVDVVADFRLSHGAPHFRSWTSNGIATHINNPTDRRLSIGIAHHVCLRVRTHVTNPLPPSLCSPRFLCYTFRSRCPRVLLSHQFHEHFV